ncbi:hypothetical protein NESM_000102400 [Novymonas esmeraldas]|uniref:Uncharacterized protein n=1 Tax=Novymonas esmeraldas TaxID=1808958 RepID=A0AAW0F3S8_9TRYP
MLGEELEIGYFAEDAYAGYVTDLATHLHLTPAFRSARGATLDVVFTGPFLSRPAYRDAVRQRKLRRFGELVLTESEPAEVTVAGTSSTVVTLHGWIEKLNAARKVQLMEPLLPAVELGDLADGTVDSQLGDGTPGKCASASPPSRQDGAATDEASTRSASASSRYRVVGSLDFLLHLSTDDPGASELGCVDGDSGGSDDVDDDDEPAPPVDDETRVDHARRDALEQRDDFALARNAVDTVIKFAQLAEEHPGAVGSVYVDLEEDVEYIRFGDA